MGCEAPRTFPRLKPGDIVPVFGIKGKTLALISRIVSSPDGFLHEAHFIDGSFDEGLTREMLGNPISTSDTAELFKQVFRGLDLQEVFTVLMNLRRMSRPPAAE